jgi:hypothetical protein
MVSNILAKKHPLVLVDHPAQYSRRFGCGKCALARSSDLPSAFWLVLSRWQSVSASKIFRRGGLCALTPGFVAHKSFMDKCPVLLSWLLVGAAAVIFIRPILPYALAFAAGAMIYVVVEELIPESQLDKLGTHFSTAGAMLGFAIMMTLDVALG